MIYVIGSLRNPKVPLVAERLRKAGFDVFDDWYAAGPEADDKWQEYEKARGRSYQDGLSGLAAGHVYEFDLKHLNRARIGVLVTPAGKSGHLELGYMIGQGKPGYILMDAEPERWDVMYKFAEGVYYDVEDLVAAIQIKEAAKTAQEPALPNVLPVRRRRMVGESFDFGGRP